MLPNVSQYIFNLIAPNSKSGNKIPISEDKKSETQMRCVLSRVTPLLNKETNQFPFLYTTLLFIVFLGECYMLLQFNL